MAKPATAARPAPAPAPQGVAFGGSEGVIELKLLLKPFEPAPSAKPDGSAWYTFTASNDTDRPAIRVLQAGQPPGSGLDVFPRGTRPSILQLASANQKVIVERANAYGRHAYRLTISLVHGAGIASR